MKRIAKDLGLKSKQVTYVGVHNRRTDSIEFIRKGWFQEELDEDFFRDAMEYFK